MAGVKISQLQDGGALQPTDAFPVARGSFTRKIAGSELLTPTNFNVADSPTINLNWDSTTRTLSADVSTAVKEASAFNVVDSSTIDLNWNASTRTLSADVSTAVKEASAFNVVDSSTIDLDWNASTRTLSAGIQNGFIFVPVFDPVTTTNCGVDGINVINYSVTGPTNSTDFTGATQTATLTPPSNAYVALIKVEINCNTNDSSTTGGVNLYFRKNSSDPWRLGLSTETLTYTIEANETAVFPIIFNYSTKTFQAYLYHNKNSTASSPKYTFSVGVLGYFIK
jgi:hypothetical protein